MPTQHLTARRVLLAALLAGPTVLAFFSGGFFDEPRLVALIVAWSLLALAVVAGAPPLPRTRFGLLALGGLGAYAGWIALSGTWSPLPSDAADDAQRALLYVGAFAASIALLRDRAGARAAEPALLAGACVVIGYGLAGRLAPGLVHEFTDAIAGGRLDEPLTYWNAMGALAAIAFTLGARIAGDPDRRVALRCAAGATTVPMLVAVYLTFSRGALAAVAAGLIVLTVLAPTWGQLRASAIALEVGALGVLVAAAVGPVRTASGTLSSRETAGAAVIAILLVLMGGAAALVAWSASTERSGSARTGRLGLPSWTPTAATVLVVAIVVVPVAVARDSRSPSPAIGQTSARLSSVGSNRYAYWKVAVRAGVAHPIAGVGASGFAAQWLEHRPFTDTAHDAHSLEIETFAELGIIGLALLAALFAGVWLSARSAHAADPALVAGPGAALAVWVLHSAIDWDWEMPALTLLAVVLAGLLVAAHERLDGGRRTVSPAVDS